MRKLITFIPFLSLMLWSPCHAQSSTLDSLKEITITLSQDTNKVNHLLEISSILFGKEPDTALIYAQEALSIARATKFKKGEGYALKNIGLAYYVKGNFVEVYDYWQQSLEVFKSIPFQLGISNLNSNIGAVHFNYADYPKALEFYLESLKAAEKLDDPLRISTALQNIGAVHSKNANTYDKALDYYQKAIPFIKKTNNLEGIGTVNVNIGEIYFLKEEYHLALNYLEKALKTLEQSGGDAAFVLTNIGKTYAAQGQKEKAIAYHRRAIKSAKDKNAQFQLVLALVGFGNSYLNFKEYRAARNNYLKAKELAEESGLKSELKDIYKGLANSYAGKKDYRRAFNYQSLFIDIKDTLYNEETNKKLATLEFRSDLEKKEAQIEILQKENALSEAAVQRANILRNSFIALAGLLIVILLGIFYQYRYVRKSNKIIEAERNRAERILLNILPIDAAEELKHNGFVQAKKFDKTTVLFTDFKDFTKVAESTTPEHLVKTLDYYFTQFDKITSHYQLEKIKTIGDSYMCVGGLPSPNSSSPRDVMNAAIEMAQFVEQVKKEKPENIIPFDIRLGINTGPVVAGVVGTKKFQYDIWGNTVNLASRMESSSIAGKINISENTYRLVKDDFECNYRGEIEAKNGQKLKMYFVENH